MTEMKQIYFNGKLVGELPTAESDELEIEATSKFLEDKGLLRVPNATLVAFTQARSFAATSASLFERDLSKLPRNGASVAPFVVNSAFAIELYLKALGRLDGIELRGHDLLELFDALPSQTHAAIEQNFSKARWRCGIATLAEFRQALKEMRRAFEEWRYLYEKERTGTIRFFQMIFAMEMLHATCERHEQIQSALQMSSRL